MNLHRRRTCDEGLLHEGSGRLAGCSIFLVILCA